MKPLFASLALVIATLPCVAAAQGRTIWRCGPDGRSFSDQPCAQGQAMALNDARRPADDVSQARQRAADDRRLADQMTRERLKSESAARGSGYSGMPLAAAGVKPAAAPLAQKKRRPHRSPHPSTHPPEDDGIWRAVAPASPRARD